MTNKELQKLGRRELLQLLLEQAKEAERLSKLLKESDERLKQLEETYERLRDRLDQKDAQIHELRDKLKAEQEKPGAGMMGMPRFGGGYVPPQPGMEPYQQNFSQSPLAGAAQAGADPGPVWAAQPREPYQPQAGVQSPQAPGPAPYQYQPQAVQTPQAPEPFSYAGQGPDPFPYQVSYREVSGMESGAPAPDSQYHCPPPPRQERRRPGGRMPFRLKKEKDQENGKTTLFFGWQHD